MEIILTKLDLVTLCRCNVALSRDTFLPQIVSLATPLPVSLFSPDQSKFWYGRLINKILSKIVRLLMEAPRCIFVPLFLTSCAVHLWVNTPLLSEEIRFLRRLSGLKSLEVELPAFPCVDCRARPNLWFKWVGKVGVYGTVDHFVYVFGDTVDDSDGGEHKRRRELLVRGLKIAARHTMLHWSVVYLGFEGGSWKTGMSITTKDVEGNGGLEIGPRSCPVGGKARAKIFHLPLTSIFSRSISEGDDTLQVQDVLLMLLAIFRNGEGVDHVIPACLGDLDDKEGDTDRTTTELRQIVKQILADDNCKLLLELD
ncbi:hypothetical protein RND81_09G172200 [Saponaria officinalis]|uniref:Uncharacterized protein n=1 Tax=Saponaria officinalis TaxID=3572 RepID=A0AAW1IMZ0_SAPOF